MSLFGGFQQASQRGTVVALASLCAAVGAASAQAAPSVYVANGGGTTVSQYRIGAAGLLSPFAPATVPAGNSPFWVVISLDGREAYVTNMVDNTVSHFDVSSSGTLVAKPPVLGTGTTPWGWRSARTARTSTSPTPARTPSHSRRPPWGRPQGEDPAHGGGRRPAGWRGGKPGRQEPLRRECGGQHGLAVRRTRRWSALAEVARHRSDRQYRRRRGGCSERQDGLRQQPPRQYRVAVRRRPRRAPVGPLPSHWSPPARGPKAWPSARTAAASISPAHATTPCCSSAWAATARSRRSRRPA